MLVLRTSIQKVLSWYLHIIHRWKMHFLTAHYFIRHSRVKKVKISFVCHVSNLGGSVYVPTGTLNVFVRHCFVNDFITWESGVQNRDGLVFWASKENRDIRLIPLNFVDFSGVMVSGVDVGLGGDIPDFDSAVSRAWGEDSDVSGVEWQADDRVGVWSWFELFVLVGELFRLFAFGDQLSSEGHFGLYGF